MIYTVQAEYTQDPMPTLDVYLDVDEAYAAYDDVAANTDVKAARLLCDKQVVAEFGY